MLDSSFNDTPLLIELYDNVEFIFWFSLSAPLSGR